MISIISFIIDLSLEENESKPSILDETLKDMLFCVIQGNDGASDANPYDKSFHIFLL